MTLIKFFILAILLNIGYAQAALIDHLEIRPEWSFPKGDPTFSTWDAPNHNIFSHLAPYVSSEFYQLNSLTLRPGESVSATHFYELGSYRNTMGVVDSSGFVPLASSHGTIPFDFSYFNTNTHNDTVTFALNSPEGIFYSVDKLNHNGSPQMIAQVVVNAGTLTLTSANWAGNQSVTIELQNGDVVLYSEDIKLVNSDGDYNDFVIVLRETPIEEVPEPSTVLLFLAGCSLLLYYRNSLALRNN